MLLGPVVELKVTVPEKTGDIMESINIEENWWNESKWQNQTILPKFQELRFRITHDPEITCPGKGFYTKHFLTMTFPAEFVKDCEAQKEGKCSVVDFNQLTSNGLLV